MFTIGTYSCISTDFEVMWKNIFRQKCHSLIHIQRTTGGVEGRSPTGGGRRRDYTGGQQFSDMPQGACEVLLDRASGRRLDKDGSRHRLWVGQSRGGHRGNQSPRWWVQRCTGGDSRDVWVLGDGGMYSWRG